jgi:hypothetical protein
VADARVGAVVAMTLKPPTGEATHWTARAMAGVTGLAVSTVQKIWKSHGLAPHRWRSFKLSNDPAFAEKLRDVIGLYVAPPAHAVVLSIDEKSQIQALDRTQPGLPLKKGRGATLTHDYKRNGTTTLFAALNVLDGTVIGQNMQRHRHQDFIRFLDAVERDVPADNEPPRVYRSAKLSENCPLWNRHGRRRPRSRIPLSSASARCGWRWNTAMSIRAKLRR